LGGQGPKDGDEEIRYGRVANYNGIDLDLVVTAQTTYSAHDVTRNNADTAPGMSGCFGAINVKNDTSVRLRFEFQNSNGGALDFGDDTSFVFGIYDIDHRGQGNSEEVVFNTRTSTSQGPIVGKNVKETSKDPYTFVSTAEGDGRDNAKLEGDVAVQHQRDRSVSVLYNARTSWEVTLKANGGDGGRNFLFHGCMPAQQFLLWPEDPYGRARDYLDHYHV